MHSTARLGTMFSRRRLGVAAASVGLSAVAAVTALGGTATAATKASTGTVVTTLKGAFGTMLVSGSGPFAGTALYSITSDYPGHIGCTTKVVIVVGSPSSCTGSTSGSTAEWPALLTTGAPVAGPGIRQSLLGEVHITGLGEQVTYNGHPLYLFDQIPGVITGENWDEPSLPPWHGVWYLINPAGSFLPRPAMLTTVTIKGRSVLAATMEDGGGFLDFPVYGFSAGSACKTTCADAFPPLISRGEPSTTGAASSGRLGSIRRPDGTMQVTYDGHPLYLDSDEALAIGPSGVAAEGNGNGAKAPAPYTGTFSFVAPRG